MGRTDVINIGIVLSADNRRPQRKTQAGRQLIAPAKDLDRFTACPSLACRWMINFGLDAREAIISAYPRLRCSPTAALPHEFPAGLTGNNAGSALLASSTPSHQWATFILSTVACPSFGLHTLLIESEIWPMLQFEALTAMSRSMRTPRMLNRPRIKRQSKSRTPVAILTRLAMSMATMCLKQTIQCR